MRTHPFLFAFIFTLILNFLSADAQHVVQDFTDYQRQALTEKVFVHTDKETYLTGETIWFSVYDVDGMFHKPLDLSKAAYVEVLDQDNRPLLQTKIQLKNGRGGGSLDIPDMLSARYTLRAYTRWMRNFGPEYFFEKEVVIINSGRPNTVRVNETRDQNDISIRFFPEGGQLVQNIKSKVAFQATGNDGKGIDVTGYFRNEGGDSIASFKTLKFGIGSFSFLPLPGVRYEAVVSYEGKLSRHAVPIINPEGFALSVTRLPNGKIHVIISSAGIKDADTVILFVHARNKIKLTKATTLKDNKGGFLIDRNKLDEGISHFTLFNGAGQPVCERLYFIKPEIQLKPDIIVEKTSFTKREKVTMNIAAKTTHDSTVSASLSVSVYKVDSMQFSSPMNILHYLMLCSDLKGTIESPEYYFNSSDSVVNEATDNLMLTHGWRRFTWTDILERKNVSLPFGPEYEGMVISGTMFRRESNAAAVTQNAYLAFPGADPQFFTAQTDVLGRFEFLVRSPVGRREVLIQSARNPEAYNVLPDPPFSEEYSSRKTYPLLLADNIKNSVLLNSIHSQASAYYKKETKVRAPTSTDSVLFYGTPDKVYELDDYKRFPTMEDVMREYVPEVMVKAKGNRSGLFVLNRRNEEYFEADPLVLIDGAPVTSTHRVVAMPAAGVKTVDVVARRYRLGPATFDGIISLKTAKGQLGGLEPEGGAYAFDFEGLQALREFYSPVYQGLSEESDRIPDFRNVLFWQPNLETSDSGKQQVNFYTSDEAGTFVVVVQGLTTGGVAGYGTITFKVSNP